ncbi:MAG: SusC/RagA family TonB-linked outer membrane protein [Bacteroidales bacterium]|nr:SusC/RagA family TonB-linked outer membrane protein [Bacteroidales bacterium]
MDEQDSIDHYQNKEDTLKTGDNFQRRISSETASSVQLSTSDFNHGALLSPLEMIKGKVLGMRISRRDGSPGSYSRLNIRGATNLSGFSTPLYVIDGVPIDPKYYTDTHNPLLFLNSEDIRQINVLKDVAATTQYGSRGASGVIVITTKSPSVDSSIHVRYQGELGFGTNPSTVPVVDGPAYRDLIQEKYPDNEQALNALGDANTDWQDALFRRSFHHNHHIGFSGNIASLSMPFRASIGYDNNEGTLKHTSLERTGGSVRLRPSYLDNHLEMDINVKGVKMDRQRATRDYTNTVEALQNALLFNPTQPIHTSGGEYYSYSEGSESDYPTPQNPLAQLDRINNTLSEDYLFTSLGLRYQMHFFPKISLNLHYGGMDYDQSEKVGIPPELFSPSNGVVYDKDNSISLTDRVWRGSLNYSEYFKEIHSSIDLKTGYSNQENRREQHAIIRHIDNGNNEEIVSDQNSIVEQTRTSLFGMLDFDYKNRYFLSLAYTREGSSRFAEDNKYQSYPGASFAWRADREPFFRNTDFFDKLKVRLGYGKSGRINLNPYGGEGALSRNLRMPVTTSLNAGIEFSMAESRVYGTIDWYSRETANMLVRLPVWLGNETYYRWSNSGGITNKGFEFSLNGLPVKTKDIHWHMGINLTTHNTTIESIVNGNNDYSKVTGAIIGGVGQNVMLQTTDHPVRMFYLYEQVYSSDGTPIEGLYDDNDDNGVINEDDKQLYKNASPDFTIGFYTDFKYRKFNLSLTGRIWSGNYLYNNVASNHSAYSKLYHENGYLRNIATGYTHFDQRQLLSDYYLEDASFLKLDRITLSYDLKGLYNEKFDLKVYASIRNVFTVTDYNGLDPEIPSGVDYLRYPVPRVFRLGVTADFN